MIRPCLCCSAYGDQLFEVVGVSLSSFPAHLNIDDDYAVACARCELFVVIENALVHRAVLVSLKYDK